MDHGENEITTEELIDRYYNNPDDYFIRDDNSSDDAEKNIENKEGLADYVQNDKIASESQEKSEENIEPISSGLELSKKIVDEPVSTNFLYSCYHKD